MIRCTQCHKELNESYFFPSFLKKHQYQCKKCHYEKWGKKANIKYAKSLKELPIKDLDRYCGGYKIFVLNYVKAHEYKYTIKSTKGEIFQTNNLSEFLEHFNLIIQS